MPWQKGTYQAKAANVKAAKAAEVTATEAKATAYVEAVKAAKAANAANAAKAAQAATATEAKWTPKAERQRLAREAKFGLGAEAKRQRLAQEETERMQSRVLTTLLPHPPAYPPDPALLAHPAAHPPASSSSSAEVSVRSLHDSRKRSVLEGPAK